MIRRAVCCLVTGSLAAQAGAQSGFTEEAAERGLEYVVENDVTQFGAGVALVDLDSDGDADAVLTGRADDAIGVYENDGTGHFTNRTAVSQIDPLEWTSGVAAGDYDADGDLDLYISRFGADDKLFRNDGGFAFTDVTAEAGILARGNGMGAAWGDYDLDGYLDLYVCNRTLAGGEPTRNRLYHNLGDGTFEEVAEALGVADGDAPTLVCSWLDYDIDGDADLYLGTDKGTGPDWDNALFQNQGDGTFVEVTEQTNTAANVDCMGIAIGDFDLDGHKDLYVTNTPSGNVLLMNDGDDTFTDATREAEVGSYAVGWATAFFDYDHDAILDLYACDTLAPNRLYKHDGTFPCDDVASAEGVADDASSYCLAIADVDLDGDLDLLVQSHEQNVRLYINGAADGKPFTRLRVSGEGANTFGVGATVRVTAGGVTQMREVHAGCNYKSDNERTLHCGLTDPSPIDEIHVLWPGGTTRTISDMPANTTWTLYPPEQLGDGDRDGDVDVDDLVALLLFLDGLASRPVEPGVEMFDFDGNAVIDVADVMSTLDAAGPGILAPHASNK